MVNSKRLTAVSAALLLAASLPPVSTALADLNDGNSVALQSDQTGLTMRLPELWMGDAPMNFSGTGSLKLTPEYRLRDDLGKAAPAEVNINLGQPAGGMQSTQDLSDWMVEAAEKLPDEPRIVASKDLEAAGVTLRDVQWQTETETTETIQRGDRQLERKVKLRTRYRRLAWLRGDTVNSIEISGDQKVFARLNRDLDDVVESLAWGEAPPSTALQTTTPGNAASSEPTQPPLKASKAGYEAVRGKVSGVTFEFPRSWQQANFNSINVPVPADEFNFDAGPQQTNFPVNSVTVTVHDFFPKLSSIDQVALDDRNCVKRSMIHGDPAIDHAVIINGSDAWEVIGDVTGEGMQEYSQTPLDADKVYRRINYRSYAAGGKLVRVSIGAMAEDYDRIKRQTDELIASLTVPGDAGQPAVAKSNGQQVSGDNTPLHFEVPTQWMAGKSHFRAPTPTDSFAYMARTPGYQGSLGIVVVTAHPPCHCTGSIAEVASDDRSNARRDAGGNPILKDEAATIHGQDGWIVQVDLPANRERREAERVTYMNWQENGHVVRVRFTGPIEKHDELLALGRTMIDSFAWDAK